MKSRVVQRLVMTALLASIICVTTAFLFHIPVGTSGGYIHLGDAFIYLAAGFLPTPYAMAAAGVGAGLADILSGAPHWAVFTVLIKAAMAACFTCKAENVLVKRNVIAMALAGVIGIVGYYFAEVILFGNWIAPILSTLWGGSAQAIGAAVMFWLVGVAFDRANVKKRLMK